MQLTATTTAIIGFAAYPVNRTLKRYSLGSEKNSYLLTNVINIDALIFLGHFQALTLPSKHVTL